MAGFNLNRLGNICCWIGRDAKGRDAVQANARDRGDKAKEYTVIRGYIPTYSTGKMFRSDRSTEPSILLVPTPSMIVVFYPCRVMVLYRNLLVISTSHSNKNPHLASSCVGQTTIWVLVLAVPKQVCLKIGFPSIYFNFWHLDELMMKIHGSSGQWPFQVAKLEVQFYVSNAM